MSDVHAIAPGLYLSGNAYIEQVMIFEDLTLQIASGEWHCLLGASGVGKSTVLRLFAGLNEGIKFGGTLSASDGFPFSNRVTFMAQNDLLLPWLNARENVLLGTRLRGQVINQFEADTVLEKVGLADHRLKKPSQLSGGQRQRVALARTLIEERPIVLLDEPFSALDAKTRSQMQELAVDLLKGKTVLLVTHDPAEASRLGQAISIMSSSKLEKFLPPVGIIPRGLSDPETLSAQGSLLRILRGTE
jgi:putative hydroxymethylpyrimidine transport system ATP-binding protein